MQSCRLEAPAGTAAWLPQIASIYEGIDRAYRDVARAYDFHCSGCKDNCCRSRFYHHTVLEFFFLREGFRRLPEGRQDQIVRHARSACRQVEAGAAKILCPLNTAGRCSLYPYRPMICRMHGIPHKLHHPVRGWINGSGCEQFPAPSPGENALRFDRTPFYRQVARLEQQMKADLNLNGRIRMTVAEMILNF